MIIGLHSFKGGSGKTFVATNLGYKLSEKGRKVCVIELDMKAPSLHSFFETEKFVNELLTKKASARDYLNEVKENLSVIVASPSLQEIKRDLMRSDVESLKILKRLQEVLAELKSMNFDFIILDNPPGLSYMSVNSMLVSDIIFFVSRAEKDDLAGLNILYEVSKNVEKQKYVILNRITERTKNIRLSYPVAAKIPCSCEITDEPFFVETFKEHEVSRAFDELAEKILGLR
ncbi:Cobyrinic acid ac-diamide synthase [Ferroglobus placidus DSM 10642]|uniref:Cobyrinic acid ac-diamide synthase n=1 Tax=Ferroglobus placidus (strain DSM 10642 / AEDII12DO) TaxID=589924 RepID=D3RX23_FERPA|nr:ParA family protein [Ferroglobus placidus]ADC65036.1 Cobyrinic acid ac-diamide synthase [Ferroglobus placidus DSM 10642]